MCRLKDKKDQGHIDRIPPKIYNTKHHTPRRFWLMCELDKNVLSQGTVMTPVLSNPRSLN